MLESIRNLFRRDVHVASIGDGETYRLPALKLVISSNGVWHKPNPKGENYRKLTPDFVELIIGAPGLPNVKKNLQLGDAVLYQLPDYGVVEIRAIRVAVGKSARLLISEVSPRRGLSAAYVADTENSAFSVDESARIASDFAAVITEMAARPDVSPEQLDLLRLRLAEISEASTRIGRKDWIMFAAGTVSNVVVAAAFGPDAARALFLALNSNLSWVFQNALRLVGN